MQEGKGQRLRSRGDEIESRKRRNSRRTRTRKIKTATPVELRSLQSQDASSRAISSNG